VSSTRSPSSVNPQATWTPSFGPSERTAMNVASRNRATQPELVEIAPAEALEAFLQLLADPRHRRLRQLPQPRLSAQRLDIAHRQAPDERADHQRLQRLRAQQLRRAREQLGRERLRRLADLRHLDLELPLGGLHRPRAEPVPQPALLAALLPLIVRPALVAGTPQPRIELVLHSPLDDQAGTQPSELRQRLARVLPNSYGK